MIDKPLLIAVIALLTLSLVMSYSLSLYATIRFDVQNDLYFFQRQIISVFMGIMMMVILSKLEPDVWFSRFGLLLFSASFLLMAAMQFLPSSLVTEVGGAKRWIRFGPIGIAPVEFFKVGFVFFLAWSFSRKFVNREKMSFLEEVRAFAPYLFVFLVAVVIIAVFQKDLGQVVVLGATLMIMFLLIGSSLKFFFSMLGAVLMAFLVLIFFAPHRMARIKSWWGTVQDSILSIMPFESVQKLRIAATEEPFQISNSLNAIYNGGFFGTGLGNGQFKLGYLSEVHTDFILAGITEELGLLGLSLVVFTVLFIIFRIFKIAAKVENPRYYLFSIGVALLISFAFILNAYGISGITPIKGIAVPFLSYGGSHIMAICVGIGMVFMVSKKVPRNEQGMIL